MKRKLQLHYLLKEGFEHDETTYKPTTACGTRLEKFSGYLREWNTSKMLVIIAFYLDILESPKILSLTLKDHEVDTVKAINTLCKMKYQL